MTSGRATPVIVMPAAVALAFVIVRLEAPLFVIVTDCDAVPPSGTEPKLMAAGATEIVASLEVDGWLDELFGAPVTPVHPEVPSRSTSKKAVTAAEDTLAPK